jgi:hypothetical protein
MCGSEAGTKVLLLGGHTDEPGADEGFIDPSSASDDANARLSALDLTLARHDDSMFAERRSARTSPGRRAWRPGSKPPSLPAISQRRIPLARAVRRRPAAIPGNFEQLVGWLPFAKPIAVVPSMMGIACAITLGASADAVAPTILALNIVQPL